MRNIRTPPNPPATNSGPAARQMHACAIPLRLRYNFVFDLQNYTRLVFVFLTLTASSESIRLELRSGRLGLTNPNSTRLVLGRKALTEELQLSRLRLSRSNKSVIAFPPSSIHSMRLWACVLSYCWASNYYLPLIRYCLLPSSQYVPLLLDISRVLFITCYIPNKD